VGRLKYRGNDSIGTYRVTSLPLRRRTSDRSRGQALVEFAIILPLLLLLLAGIVQFGLMFWAQNTVTQIARDTGRWAATQTTGPCSTGASAVNDHANEIALSSSLINYGDGMWNGTNLVTLADNAPLPATRHPEGVEIVWSQTGGTTQCPPAANTEVWWVTIRVSHVAPVFFPFLTNIPGLGTCDSSGCSISLTSTTQFRMEPSPL
jgi:Tfp pilus assembly protein PilW